MNKIKSNKIFKNTKNKTQKKYKNNIVGHKINILTNIAITKGLILPYKNYDIKFDTIVPKNTFGLFVSVKRSSNDNDNIHGCIGNWNNNFTNMNVNKIVKTLENISYSAANTDSRKKKFKELYKDIYSKFEISLMLNPLLKINKITGIMANGLKFNNNKYGLIVVYNQKKATYLPKVFNNKSWIYIRNNLIEKALSKKLSTNEFNNIVSKNIVEFFAYKVKIYEDNIYSIVNNNYKDYIIYEFLNNINNNYIDFIPYEIKNGATIVTKNQNVRNCGMLYTLSRFFENLKKKDLLHNNILYYIEKFNNDKINMRQASPFLLLSIFNILKYIKKNIYLKNIYKKTFNDIISLLETQLQNIESNSIDKNFELGEICMALNIVKPDVKLLKNIDNIMYNELSFETVNKDTIFRINWHIKFLFNNPHNIKYNDKHKILLISSIENICENLTETDETNYLAVGFEALKTCNSNRKDLIFKLFYFLQKRFINGLYYFKDLSTARYDITGHVLDQVY